jgi:hypothetical protein
METAELLLMGREEPERLCFLPYSQGNPLINSFLYLRNRHLLCTFYMSEACAGTPKVPQTVHYFGLEEKNTNKNF